MTATLTIYTDTQDPQDPGLCYRHIDADGYEENQPLDSLSDLLHALRMGADEVIVMSGECSEQYPGDMDDLPTFGGATPEDTDGVWSWDETHLLVGTCSDDYEIVARTEVL